MATSRRKTGAPSALSAGLFAQILTSKTQVSERYLLNDDGLLADVTQALGQIATANAGIRAFIDTLPVYPYCAIDWAQNTGPVVIDMAAVAAQTPIDRSTLYAIDGTPASPHLRYSALQLCAVAVMGMSYETLHQPEVLVAKTATNLTDDREHLGEWEKLLGWIKEQDIAATNQSWPTTFREYVEREYAIAKQQPFTLIDGPLCTQNLITQADGRALLLTLLQQPIRLCGVIKNLKASTVAHQLIAHALKPGEALLIESSWDLIVRRNVHEEAWMRPFFSAMQSQGTDLWRGVYRPVTKAFGFECESRHVESVIAMLWQERDRHHLGHELPFLLNQVDAHVRAAFNHTSLQHHLNYRLGLDLAEADLFDEIDERDFR